jgi:selenocysteine lyase/cysteine desulfurase
LASLTCKRALFEIPEDVSFLNCAYIGPSSRAVRAAGERGVASKCRPWEIKAADFFEDIEKLRGLFATIIGGDADGVALIPSASYGITVAANAFPISKGQGVLVLEDQFPSNVYPWRARAPVVTVPRPADHDWTRAVLERLDKNIAVVAVESCHWTDGSALDLAAIGARARELGAALLIDASQSIGALPFHVKDVRPDAVVTVGYKWLLGPYSLGYLWLAERWREARPFEENWINRLDSDDFARLVNYRDEYQPGARRFDVGEKSNFTLVPMAIAALEQILEWGPARIADYLGGLTRMIEAASVELGLRPVPARCRGPHMLGIGFPEGVPPALLANLAAKRVFVSIRGQSMRVSPHLYNDHSDVERLIHGIEAAKR